LEGDAKLKKGFCVLVCDKPNYAKMTEGLGEKYTISDVYFKPFACCRINHSPVEIAIDLAKRHDIKPEVVATVHVKTYNFAAAVPGNIRTNVNSNLLECQFSTSYTVAVALSDRRLGMEQFTPERIRDPKLQDLASRVSIAADPKMEAMRPANRACIVEVTLKDGKTVTGRVDYPLGDPRKPFSDAELMKKFQGLAAHVLNQDKVNKLSSLVFELDKVADVGELVAFCS
jgi:2-methylcitrate dehydratase PrpD